MPRCILLLLMFVTMLAAGCTTTYPTLQITPVPTQKVQPIEPGAEKKAVAVDQLVSNLPLGKVIGTLQFKYNCDTFGDVAERRVRSHPVREDPRIDAAIRKAIFQTLRRAGINVVGDPDKLFKPENEAHNAELKLGGVVQDFKSNFCRRISMWDNRNLAEFNGEAYVKMKWVIYSIVDQKVVYEKVTEGYFKGEKESEELNTFTILLSATANCLSNLLADSGFMRLVRAAPGVNLAKREKRPKLKINTWGVKAHALPAGLEEARNAVVTVLINNAHGSGFFISDSGFILTNHHVAGGAKYVPVRTHTGRRMIAEVVASSAEHDVALLKVGESGIPALPLAGKEPAVGADVWAIGAPMEEELHSSVSKGIVSAYRSFRGVRHIQNDASIAGGNSGGPLLDSQGRVVGIVASGMRIGGAPTGQNFAIAINEAIEALGLELPGRK